MGAHAERLALLQSPRRRRNRIDAPKSSPSRAKAKPKPAKARYDEAERVIPFYLRSPVLEPFFRHVPPRPYCANDFKDGLSVRSFPFAIGRRYIQPNGPGMVWTIPIDVDHDVAAQAAGQDWAIGPEPNLIVINPSNGHGHFLFYLKAGVPTTDAARLAPLRYLAAIKGGLRELYRGDPAYSGLTTKNPIHPSWQTVERHNRLWSLGDLAAGLDLKAANAKAKSRRRQAPEIDLHAVDEMRNVTLFDATRFWAYSAIQDYWAPGGLPQWLQAVFEHVEALNDQLQRPLPYPEVKSISKSIARWTWQRITPEGRADLIAATHTPEQQRERGRKATNQSEAGKASGKARRAASEDLQKIADRMWVDGQSYRAIAKALGVSTMTVYKWLNFGG